MDIIINNKHTLTEYGMYMNDADYGVPIVKENKVDVVGADGVLDFTEAFGRVNYSNRIMMFNFSKPYYSLSEKNEFISDLMNEYHGKTVEIINPDELGFKYIGRMTLTFSHMKNILLIVAKVDAEPYKIKTSQTVVEQTGNGTVTLTNLKKNVVPTIVTTAQTKIVNEDGHEANVSSGTFVIPEFELHEGDNDFTITTTGKVTFKYTEGGF